jgi:hypothetical protein
MFGWKGCALFTAAEIAAAIVENTGVSEGCICSSTAHRDRFESTAGYKTACELEEALIKYCTQYDTTSYDYKVLYVIYFKAPSLYRITVTVVDDSPKATIRSIELATTRASPYDKLAYEIARDTTVSDKRDRSPSRRSTNAETGVFLPPLYSGSGQHISGGVPGMVYPAIGYSGSVPGMCCPRISY